MTQPERVEPVAGSTRRLGVFGGTFDPIHIGHLIIAEEVWAHLALDSVVFVPARVSPLKRAHHSTAAEDRLRMVELAVEGNPHFGVSRIDLDRQGPSFTVDTLQCFHTMYAGAELFFIMGADSLASFAGWYRPAEIMRLARLVAISRPGIQVDLAAIEADLPGVSAAIEVITTLQLGISSTDIRARVRQGLPIRYQVPASVEDYIRCRGLYTSEGDTRAQCPARACY